MIKVENISKNYGALVAVDSLSFELSRGEIVGFIGANGAGKSTTMKILAGILKPNMGSVSIFGNDTIQSPLQAKKHIGYLPEDNPLYGDMYVKEYLQYVSKIYRAPQNALERILYKTGLEKEYKKKIDTLSKGNRQRVGLAQALIHDPDFLILDEPTSGLDPHQQFEIRELLLDIAQSKIIFFSTHMLQEVSNMCSRVIIIHRGRIVQDAAVNKDIDIDKLFYSSTK